MQHLSSVQAMEEDVLSDVIPSNIVSRQPSEGADVESEYSDDKMDIDDEKDFHVNDDIEPVSIPCNQRLFYGVFHRAVSL